MKFLLGIVLVGLRLTRDLAFVGRVVVSTMRVLNRPRTIVLQADEMICNLLIVD
jgi:hypothetical protein